MSNTILSTDKTVVSHRNVIVERELSQKDGGIVGTIRIQTIDQSPVLVRIVDEFPDGLPIDEIGFNPGEEPESGDITPRRATIEQPIAGESVRIEYGITLAGPAGEVQFDPPTIRDVEAATVRGSTAPAVDDGGVSSAGSGGGDEPATPVSSMIPTADDGPDDPGSSASQQPPGTTGTPPDVETSATDESAAASKAPVEAAIEQVDEPESDTGTESGADDPATDTHAHRPGGTSSDGTSGDDDDPTSDPESPTGVNAPVEDANGTDALGGGRGGGAEPAVPRSVEARIDRLSARVEEFAAYATALQDLIDEHGTAPEFIDRVEGELAALDGRVRSIREEVETVRDHRAGAVDDLRGRTDDLERRLEDARSGLDAELDDVHERLDAEVADRGSEIERVERDLGRIDDRVAGVEGDLESVHETVRTVEADVSVLSRQVDAMGTELEALRAEVRELTEVQESLAEVFGASGGGQEPD